MNGPATDTDWERQQMENELAARISQKSNLMLKLDHFIQTRQDTTSVKHELDEMETEIARLEEALRAL